MVSTMKALWLTSRFNDFAAQALGDPSVTIEQVTPPVLASGPLFPSEVHNLTAFKKRSIQSFALSDDWCFFSLMFLAGYFSKLQERVVQLFEKNTYSVVNIFDVTLRPQLNVTGAVEVF